MIMGSLRHRHNPTPTQARLWEVRMARISTECLLRKGILDCGRCWLAEG